MQGCRAAGIIGRDLELAGQDTNIWAMNNTGP